MAGRRALLAAATLASAGLAGTAWMQQSARSARGAYDRAVQETWHPGGPASGLREMVRHATLAASSHNTQPWRFRVRGRTVAILPDFDRRTPVVDPDDHHLFASLGCAAENLLISAAAHGLTGQARFVPADGGAILIELAQGRPARTPLLEAIPRRQSTRAEFDGKPLSTRELGLLEAAGTGAGVALHLFTTHATLETVLDFVLRGNAAQLRDRAFVAELRDWVRFDGAHAARTRDGLFAASSGHPGIPEWLGRRIFDRVLSEPAENDRLARQLRSSAGVAVFVSETDDRAHWIEAGRAFQRFALQATALGIRTAHVNQPVEVPQLRAGLGRVLGLGSGRPDLVVRFGRGPELPRSLRRPVDAVLVSGSE